MLSVQIRLHLSTNMYKHCRDSIHAVHRKPTITLKKTKVEDVF